MEALNYLTGIAVILLVGILASVFAGKMRTSNILFLVFAGMVIGNTALNSLDIFGFPATFMVSIAILTLAIIVFDGSSKFNFKELDEFSIKALEVVLLFMLFNIILVTATLNMFYYDFTLQGIVFGMILAVIMAGTDPGSVFMMMGDKPLRTLQFLKVEALINTPIMVLFPFIFIELLSQKETGFFTFIEFISPFLSQIVVGIGSGVLVGAVIFKFMKQWYSESISPVAVISSTLISYILAENLGGNGVLAVAVLGLLFGNTYVKQKGTLLEFSSITAYSLQILVFVLIGKFVTLPTDPTFWIAALAILAVTLLSRFLVIGALLKEYKFREKMFMTLTIPKGIAVAVVALTLVLSNLQGFDIIVNLTIVLMVFTLILSTITTYYSKFFIKQNIEQKK